MSIRSFASWQTGWKVRAIASHRIGGDEAGRDVAAALPQKASRARSAPASPPMKQNNLKCQPRRNTTVLTGFIKRLETIDASQQVQNILVAM